MSNPNNCTNCNHKRNPQGGWCYAFRNEPVEVCMQHTGRKESIGSILQHYGIDIGGTENGNDPPSAEAHN